MDYIAELDFDEDDEGDEEKKMRAAALAKLGTFCVYIFCI